MLNKMELQNEETKPRSLNKLTGSNTAKIGNSMKEDLMPRCETK